ncbi:MAG: DUF882 domain-containing protein [Polyangiaceae bacterium]
MLRRILASIAAVALWLGPSSADAAIRSPRPRAGLVGLLPISETSWLVGGLERGQTFELAGEARLPLLERFLEPYRNHTPEWRAFFRGAYGPARPWLPELCWSGANCQSSTATDSDAELGLSLRPLTQLGVSLRVLDTSWLLSGPVSPEPEALDVRRRRPCPRWKAPKAVTVLRYSGEGERLALTDCSGAIDSEVLDRLSVLARPAGASRPELPLPLDPEGEAGEWTQDVKLLDPRLVWAVSELSRAFPGHSIVLMSGYRRDGHSGLHGKGRALDLYVHGVPNEQLFAACRNLRDVGCGFYPYNQFLHVDVRPYGTGRVTWIDASGPGEPSRYVDGWPGVLPPGVAWLGPS